MPSTRPRTPDESEPDVSEQALWACRAFCRSLAEPSVPPPAKIPADSNVELSWRVFGGRHHELYMGLLKERCLRDGLGADDDVLAMQFRLHLHRGIAYLASDRRIRDGVGALVGQAIEEA